MGRGFGHQRVDLLGPVFQLQGFGSDALGRFFHLHPRRDGGLHGAIPLLDRRHLVLVLVDQVVQERQRPDSLDGLMGGVLVQHGPGGAANATGCGLDAGCHWARLREVDPVGSCRVWLPHHDSACPLLEAVTLVPGHQTILVHPSRCRRNQRQHLAVGVRVPGDGLQHVRGSPGVRGSVMLLVDAADRNGTCNVGIVERHIVVFIDPAQTGGDRLVVGHTEAPVEGYPGVFPLAGSGFGCGRPSPSLGYTLM